MPAQKPVDKHESPMDQVADELRPEYGAVRFHREEQFEERISSRESPDSLFLHVYRIEQEQFDRAENSLVERISNGLPTMYIATLGNGKSVFRLAGFPDAEQNFNRLVRDILSREVRNEQLAETRGLLCSEIVYGLSPQWWLDDTSSTKLKAAEHFFAEGHENGLALAEQWWKSAKGNRNLLKITTTKSEGGYTLSLPVFWVPVEGHSNPEVKLYRVRVGADGSCQMPDPPSVILRQ